MPSGLGHGLYNDIIIFSLFQVNVFVNKFDSIKTFIMISYEYSRQLFKINDACKLPLSYYDLLYYSFDFCVPDKIATGDWDPWENLGQVRQLYNIMVPSWNLIGNLWGKAENFCL